jgi:alkylation response protein AidB-like acyl-CoA dehydrogenase
MTMTQTTSMPATTTAPATGATNGGQPVATRHWTGAGTEGRWPAAARELVPKLAEQAVAADRSGDFVHAGYDLLRQHRFPSMLVPAELGGGGATFAEACAALAELAHGCPATSLAFAMHSHLVAAQVWRYQRGLPAPVLEKVAANQLVLVSTGASDWLDSNGTATKVEGGYRISARKAPASGAPAGNVAVTSIRYEGGPDGPEVLHCAVPFTAEGVSVDETWDTMGMRATGSHTMVFDDVFVPDEAIALARPAGAWHPVWASVLGVALPLIMSSYVGVAESATEKATRLAARRADRPDVAPLVGRMRNRLTAARDTVRAMIDAADDLRFDNTIEHAAASLTRKSNAADAVIDTVRIAIEVGGGAAYHVSGGIERLYRDVHGSLYHPLPTAQQERFTGRIALGLDPVAGA